MPKLKTKFITKDGQVLEAYSKTLKSDKTGGTEEVYVHEDHRCCGTIKYTIRTDCIQLDDLINNVEDVRHVFNALVETCFKLSVERGLEGRLEASVQMLRGPAKVPHLAYFSWGFRADPSGSLNYPFYGSYSEKVDSALSTYQRDPTEQHKKTLQEVLKKKQDNYLKLEKNIKLKLGLGDKDELGFDKFIAHLEERDLYVTNYWHQVLQKLFKISQANQTRPVVTLPPMIMDLPAETIREKRKEFDLNPSGSDVKIENTTPTKPNAIGSGNLNAGDLGTTKPEDKLDNASLNTSSSFSSLGLPALSSLRKETSASLQYLEMLAKRDEKVIGRKVVSLLGDQVKTLKMLPA